jgi:hypothetical protein
MTHTTTNYTDTGMIWASYRLGRKAIKHDSRTLKFANYLTPALPPPPATADWTKGQINWGMMLNDTLGDCTIAGCGHAIQVWSQNNGSQVTVPDAQIQSYYSTWDGYVEGDTTTDNGGIELDVLTKWRKNGLSGHTLNAFAAANVKNIMEIQQAIYLFGGVYIGLALPLSARNQTVWDVVKGNNAVAGSWGGHCVFVPKYDAQGFTCITWGARITMTTAFWKKYCDESYALFGNDWLKDGVAPHGFNAAALNADLEAIH